MKPPRWRTAGRHRAGRTSRVFVIPVALTALFLTVALPGGVQAQVGTEQADPGPAAPYVVVMEAAPVVAYDGGVDGLAPTATPGGGVDSSAPEVQEYVAHLEQAQGRALAGADIPESAMHASFAYALNGFSASLTADQAARLARQPGVNQVTRDELRQLHTDTSPGFLGLDARRGAWESGFTGEGVILGVIDTGIWPEHASFADDGSYSAPPADWMGGDVACEFGDTEHNPDDAPFDCNNKLIGARDMRITYKAVIGPELFNSARDYNGHGTHTASTAGGNRDVEAEVFGVSRGTVSGIAPRAQVAAYSACGNQGCFGGDLAAAINTAVADGVDVINYSIGGGPSLTGPDDIAFLLARDAGVHVATSNGNAGPAPGTVGSPANDPWVTGVGANTHDRTFEGSVTLGDGSEFAGASLTGGTEQLPLVDAADHGNEICDPDVTFEPEITGAIVLCLRAVIPRVDKSLAVFEQGGAGMVLYNQNAGDTQVTDNHWVPSVHVGAADGQAIKAHIADQGGSAVATIGAGEAADTQGSVMAAFSSRGPTAVAESLIKPDVTAPGVNILAGNTLTPDPNLPGAGVPGEAFQAISGTSMSSPHVAGVLALLKQAHPDWTPAMAQSAVMTTARDDVFKEDGDTRADPFDMGAGHLDPGRRADRPNSVFDPGLVYDAGFNEYLGFYCDTAPEVLQPGTCEALEQAGIPTTVENLNYPSIGAAEVLSSAEIQRTVTSVADKTALWIPTVRDPKGFDVRVSPRLLVLQPGESATVTLEVTNRRAPIDEWRFGELTWLGVGLGGGVYKVESPIALKGVALSAPASVTGTGTSGSESFDVGFGYSGEYTAAAHGLVPQVGVAGSVSQDPDQNFDPEDPTGTTAHEIPLSGSGALRVELTTADLTPPDGDIDLDLYLYNSAGQEVANSTAGGTDEHIDLRLPADDTYTLYVHGWETTGLTVDYTLRTWDVPLAPDSGPLEIVSAPAEAVAGGSGTVEVAWSGLDPGAGYLGAVSHTGPDGLLGLTLVDVSTG